MSFTAQHGRQSTEVARTTQIKGPIVQHILKQSLYITVLATAYTVMSSSIILSVLNEVALLQMK